MAKTKKHPAKKVAAKKTKPAAKAPAKAAKSAKPAAPTAAAGAAKPLKPLTMKQRLSLIRVDPATGKCPHGLLPETCSFCMNI